MAHVYSLIALIAAVALIVTLISYAEKYSYFEGRHTLAMLIAIFGAGAALFASLFYCFMVFNWFGAGQRANVINREYGTHYTQAELFYASDVIDTVRELDRKRVEVNGDLFRERDAQRDRR